MAILTTACLITLIVILSSEKGKSKNFPVDHQSKPQGASLNKTVCLTDGCMRKAMYLRLSMNMQADPCEDFYEYSCGLWKRLNPIPQDSANRNVFSVLSDENQEYLKQALNQFNTASTKEESLHLLLAVYKACLDEDAMERLGDQPLRMLIDNRFGQAKLSESSTFQSRANSNPLLRLETLTAQLWLRDGINTLVNPWVGADENDTTKNMLHLDQGIPAFGYKTEDYYLNAGEPYEGVRRVYLAIMNNITRLLFNNAANTSKGVVEKQAAANREILEFEISLAGINKPASERRDPTSMYNKINVAELQKFSNFNWTLYLKEFTPVDEIIVSDLDYFNRLDKLLKRTPTAVVKGYLLWRLVFHRLLYLERRYSDNFYKFTEKFIEQARPEDRAKQCVRYLTGKGEGADYFGYAIGRLFVDGKNFNTESRQRVYEMTKQIVASFVKMLDENVWMDERTKAKAELKAEQMISNIGFPDEIINDIDSIYAALLEEQPGFKGTKIIYDDSFFVMNGKLEEWMVRKQNEQLNKPFDRHIFGGSPATVNAWYMPTTNSITFPAGILQPPFYDATAPAASNFGAIGAIIGHEITHGFDDQGSQYDEHGNLVDWFTATSKSVFKEKAHCVSDAYSQFCFPHLGKNVCLKGNHTNGENIADIGGVKESFRAYRSSTERKEEEPLASLEDFTMDQIFFLSFATIYCSNYRDAALQNRIQTNEHSPDRERVIGALQNSEDFARAFNCPLGSTMNPEKKCTVW